MAGYVLAYPKLIMKRLFKILFFGLFAAFLSCEKDKKTEPAPGVDTGNLNINFSNLVDTSALAFGKKYMNANGDTFTVDKFNYIISNVVITKNDNSNFSEANSYHIIRQSSSANNQISIVGVSVGTYKSISFMLGVDSVTNSSGSKTGELDLSKASDMYWDWSTGYIALKLEGTSPQSGASTKRLTFHVGGYGGVNKAQRTFNLGFGGAAANVSKTTTPTLYLSVDANELFKSPTTVKFATQYFQMSAGSGAKVYADNYTDMIKFEKVLN